MLAAYLAFNKVDIHHFAGAIEEEFGHYCNRSALS
jgi:hypothetical protein